MGGLRNRRKGKKRKKRERERGERERAIGGIRITPVAIPRTQRQNPT